MDITEYDSKWAGDNGAVIVQPSTIDQNCAPACEEDFHVC